MKDYYLFEDYQLQQELEIAEHLNDHEAIEEIEKEIEYRLENQADHEWESANPLASRGLSMKDFI